MNFYDFFCALLDAIKSFLIASMVIYCCEFLMDGGSGWKELGHFDLFEDVYLIDSLKRRFKIKSMI